MNTQPSWWWVGMTSERTLLYAIIATASVLALVLCYRAVRRQTRPTRSIFRMARSLCRDNSGTASIEFALVSPVMLTMMLLLAQTTMLMGGNLFVHYAAFAATRSAITVIPEPTIEEAANYIFATSGNAKFDRIQAAAAIALIPVSGQSDVDGAPADAIVEGLHTMYGAYQAESPAWVDRLIGPRVRYAFAHTQVTIYRTIVEGPTEIALEDKAFDIEPFGPREPITVRVRHDLNLGVPIVWSVFADDSSIGHYTTVDAQYTLTNEGVVNELPPRPSLPRHTPT